jgi:hypothetical protein
VYLKAIKNEGGIVLRQTCKKWFAFVIGVTAACALLSAPAYAADMSITAGAVSGNVGDIVSVPVSVSDNAGVSGMTLRMGFDDAYLEPHSVVKGELLSDGFFIDNISYADYPVETVNVTWVGAADMREDGVLYYVRFKIIKELPDLVVLNLSVNEGDIINESFDDIAPVIENGTVTTGSPDNGQENNGGSVEEENADTGGNVEEENANTGNNSTDGASTGGNGGNGGNAPIYYPGGYIPDYTPNYTPSSLPIPDRTPVIAEDDAPIAVVPPVTADENESPAPITYPEAYPESLPELLPEAISQVTVLPVIDATEEENAATPLYALITAASANDGLSFGASGMRITFNQKAVASLKRQLTEDAALTARLAYQNGSPQAMLALTGVSDPSALEGSITAGFAYNPALDEDTLSVVMLRQHPSVGVIARSYYAAGEMRFTVPLEAAADAVCVLFYNPVGFTDVEASAWYADYVRFAASRGITNGTSPGLFDPALRITRAQALMMMMNAYGVAPAYEPGENFADAGGAYYTPYLQTARASGLVSGVGDNLFAPESPITRQELFTMMYSFLNKFDECPQAGGNVPFKEVPAPWAEEAVTALTSSGVVTGENGALHLNRAASRAEMAAMLYRLINFNNDERGI